MKHMLANLQGVDTECNKIPYYAKDIAETALKALQAKGRRVRSIHWCPEHQAYHVSKGKGHNNASL